MLRSNIMPNVLHTGMFFDLWWSHIQLNLESREVHTSKYIWSIFPTWQHSLVPYHYRVQVASPWNSVKFTTSAHSFSLTSHEMVVPRATRLGEDANRKKKCLLDVHDVYIIKKLKIVSWTMVSQGPSMFSLCFFNCNT